MNGFLVTLHSALEVIGILAIFCVFALFCAYLFRKKILNYVICAYRKRLLENIKKNWNLDIAPEQRPIEELVKFEILPRNVFRRRLDSDSDCAVAPRRERKPTEQDLD